MKNKKNINPLSNRLLPHPLGSYYIPPTMVSPHPNHRALTTSHPPTSYHIPPTSLLPHPTHHGLTASQNQNITTSCLGSYLILPTTVLLTVSHLSGLSPSHHQSPTTPPSVKPHLTHQCFTVSHLSGSHCIPLPESYHNPSKVLPHPPHIQGLPSGSCHIHPTGTYHSPPSPHINRLPCGVLSIRVLHHKSFCSLFFIFG